MEHIAHFPFIVASYLAAFVVIGVLIAWIAIDYRVQRRALSELEMRGVTRRSASPRPERSIDQVKERV